MKITILGSGVAAAQLPGIPDRFPPAYVVEVAGEVVLFDCGEGTRFRLAAAGFEYAALKHIAISHSHPDHNALINLLQSTYCHGLWDATKPRNAVWNIYCPEHMVVNFPAVWNYYLPDQAGELYEFPKLQWHAMSAGPAPIALNGFLRLSAQPVYHGQGRTDAVAFRLESPDGVFAYSGDSGDCTGLRTVAQGADIFVCEASARIGDEQASAGFGHLTPYGAGKIAKEVEVKKLILVHYQGFDSNDAMLADCRRSGFEGEIAIGQDGQVFEV